MGDEESGFSRSHMEMDGYLYCYVMVYSMYHEGMDKDAITAFDPCRINQLCGDYYVCGYMIYEETMDISLENSLIPVYRTIRPLCSATIIMRCCWRFRMARTALIGIWS